MPTVFPLTTIAMASIKVLLIEDTIGIPMLKILEKWGYDVTLAEDGEQAWSIVNERLFDIFLVDWVLPGMSGPDLIIEIRQLEHYECTPIVMISGKAEKLDVVTAIGSGVDHYITKPFTAVQLRDKIADVWQSHQRKKADNQHIARVVAGHQAFRTDDVNPIVLLGEPANGEQELAMLDRRSLVAYLSAINATINSINADLPNLNLGYLIEVSTRDIIDRLTKDSMAKRVVAVLISPQCTGSSVLMARLMREHLQSNIPIFVCCGEGDHVAESELCKYEAELIRKSLVGTAQWKKILLNRAIKPYHQRQKTGNQRIARIVAGHQAFRADDVNPIVLLGEPANGEQELAMLDRRSLVAYLSAINATINSINATLPNLNLGYLIEVSMRDIIDRLTKDSLAKRVVAVLISPQCIGTPVLSTRLMRECLQRNIPILVCCDEGDRVAESELCKYEAELIRKPLIGTAQWKEILLNRAIEPWLDRYPNTALEEGD